MIRVSAVIMSSFLIYLFSVRMADEEMEEGTFSWGVFSLGKFG